MELNTYSYVLNTDPMRDQNGCKYVTEGTYYVVINLDF